MNNPAYIETVNQVLIEKNYHKETLGQSMNEHHAET